VGLGVRAGRPGAEEEEKVNSAKGVVGEDGVGDAR